MPMKKVNVDVTSQYTYPGTAQLIVGFTPTSITITTNKGLITGSVQVSTTGTNNSSGDNGPEIDGTMQSYTLGTGTTSLWFRRLDAGTNPCVIQVVAVS